MDDLKFFLGIFFKFILPIFVGVFLLFYCVNSCHDVSESSPSPLVEFRDIHYKGHTYIYLSATYSHTLIHAEHCDCKKKK